MSQAIGQVRFIQRKQTPLLIRPGAAPRATFTENTGFRWYSQR